MLHPDTAECLDESKVFVEYSLQHFEHRISTQPPAVQSTSCSFSRFPDPDEPPPSRRCISKRAATRATSSCGSSSSAVPSSPASSSSGDDNDDMISGPVKMANFLQINNKLVNRLEVLENDNAALEQQARQLRVSQFDNIVLATSVPASSEAINTVDCARASVKGLPVNGLPDYVRASMSPGDFPQEGKLFDPLSIALFNDDELPPKESPEISSLRRELGELSEDKRILMAENHCLDKEKRALEVALAKARQDVDNAAIVIVDKISPLGGRLRACALDSDVQRLCNLSRLLGDENGRLRSQNRDTEAEVRMLKEDMGELRAQNSRLMIDISSAKAHKEVLEADIERLKDVVAKSEREVDMARTRVVEEVEGARKTIEGLRDEEKRLINENARLEGEMAAVVESLEEFEEKQSVLRGEKQRAVAEVGRLEVELGNALERAANEADARRRAMERAERAEAAALELRQEAADLRFQVQQMSQELDNEKAGHEALLQEMALLRLRERALTQDMRHLSRQQPANLDIAGQLMLLPVSSPRRSTASAAAFESQLSAWLSERVDLQAVDKDLQQQVEKLSRGLSESLQDMEEEVSRWKGATAHLEGALQKARKRTLLCENNGRNLLSHLLPSSPSSKNALHAAAASGALASIGLLAYAKLKHSSPN